MISLEMNDWIGLATALIVIISAAVELFVQSRQLRGLREELEGTKAIIKDTTDLRRAISHRLEGTWSLNGEFDTFQGNITPHVSEGFLALTWVPDKKRYDAIYAYSVTKAGDNACLATTICSGYSDGDLEEGDPYIDLYMTVQSRTDWERKPNHNKNFTFHAQLVAPTSAHKSPKISVQWAIAGTSGVLTFTKAG